MISILKRFIHGEKESGLAEALLIGYKDDLDKNLVQAYTNAGVVHVIAISGLHLGIIYWLLLVLTRFLRRKKLYWTRFFMIAGSLWLFSFLAGAQPSVLRSALMFSVMAMGTVLNRNNSVYNTLALSAFVLLCWNPFWLWDVGFQLSYASVLSIIIFFRPIYSAAYYRNKIVDFFWKLLSVTIAAQILTLPFTVYYFHQFPVLFLFTNLIAVPLSSIILILEIVLCAVFFIKPLAQMLGRVIEWCIYMLNTSIEKLDQVPFAVWGGMSITVVQAILLTGVIAGLSYWLLDKTKKGFWVALAGMAVFLLIRSHSFITAIGQKKLIVYNLPRHMYIDIIEGRKNYFIGDSILLHNAFLRNFHIKPSRILHRLKKDSLLACNAFNIYGKEILIIDAPLVFNNELPKIKIDVLILSKNPSLSIAMLAQFLSIQQIIIDSSVPAWKAKAWKRDADSLHIPCYNVSEKGAFVMNL